MQKVEPRKKVRRRRDTAEGPRAGSRPYPTLSRPRFLALGDGGASLAVMIGPVRGPEHLALIHRLRFYHVPVSAIAAARTGVAFVALYEPASRFGAATGVIREYAEVLCVSRALRRDLPGLAWPGRGNADTLYYRFDLGPLLSLPQAIVNPERLRVVFRFPAVERLRRAATIRELGPAPLAPGTRVVRRHPCGTRTEEESTS